MKILFEFQPRLNRVCEIPKNIICMRCWSLIYSQQLIPACSQSISPVGGCYFLFQTVGAIRLLPKDGPGTNVKMAVEGWSWDGPGGLGLEDHRTITFITGQKSSQYSQALQVAISLSIRNSQTVNKTVKVSNSMILLIEYFNLGCHGQCHIYAKHALGYY